jgi:two-component system sensor histidine kinase ChiS
MLNAAPNTILVVEDSQINATLLAGFLGKLGYQVSTAKDGEVALQLAPQLNPDLILLDVMMPGIDGFETCRRLRAIETTQNTPIIFITALTGTDDKIKGLEAGAVDYITKPFDFAEVSARVTTHLALRTLQKSLQAQNIQLEQENTRRKQAEAALQQAHDELEQRVAARTAELAQTNQALQAEITERKRAQAEIQAYSQELKAKNEALSRLDRLKDEFLTNTSHQLLTPLNGIIGIAESMTAGAAGPLTAGQMYNLSILVSAGRKLAALVNDILDFSKLKHREIDLRLRPVHLPAVVDVVFTLAQPLAARKGIQLHRHVDPLLPPVLADESRLQQILHNLVDNALKFTETGAITATATRRNNFLAITIADTGAGVPPERAAAIFTSFDATAAADQERGPGLGLSITRQLVELHGGAIAVESTIDRGAAFTFTLPLAATEPGQAIPEPSTDVSHAVARTWSEAERMWAPTSAELARNKNCTILVVDDDLTNVQVVTNYLTLQNYNVAQAFDGQEALEALADLKPDLILLDTIMPKLSGFEVCQKIRQQYPPHELPIIMLAAKNQTADLMAGFNLGANDYLPKPVDKNELRVRVKTHLRLAKINAAYGRFVPHEFLRFLNKESIVEVNLGDQVQRNMSILFADIRDFTGLSEMMTPQENFAFLNDYLRRVSPIIRQHRGFIDKYIGDTIMALFPDHVEDAIRAAIAMQQEIARYNIFRLEQGLRPIQIGAGIHNGSLILGTVGEAQRMESTVISDAVNLAARLESLTKLYGASIIASAHALFSLNRPTDYLHRFLDRVQVPGKKEPVSVFEIFSGEPASTVSRKLDTAQDFEKALVHYHRRHFKQAKSWFEKVLAHHPEDKAAQLYLNRTNYFIKYGVPPDWVGIASLTEKYSTGE